MLYTHLLVYYSPVDRNAVTPLLRYIVVLLHDSRICFHSCTTVDKISTDIALRAVRLRSCLKLNLKIRRHLTKVT